MFISDGGGGVIMIHTSCVLKPFLGQVVNQSYHVIQGSITHLCMFLLDLQITKIRHKPRLRMYIFTKMLSMIFVFVDVFYVKIVWICTHIQLSVLYYSSNKRWVCTYLFYQWLYRWEFYNSSVWFVWNTYCYLLNV